MKGKKATKETTPVQTTLKCTEPLVQFVVKKVNGQRRKVGVLVGRLDKGGLLEIRLGWSRANFRKGDVFDKGVAMDIAMGRTKAKEFTPICHSFRKDMLYFSDRCMRYFKGARGMDIITIAPQNQKPRCDVCGISHANP